MKAGGLRDGQPVQAEPTGRCAGKGGEDTGAWRGCGGSLPTGGPHKYDTMEKLVEAGTGRRPRQTQIGQRRSPADLAGG